MARVVKNVALTAATKKKLKAFSFENEISMNQITVEILHEYGQGKPRKPTPDPAIVKDKVSVQSDIWEAAIGRAQLEGKTMLQVLEEGAARVLRS